MSLFETQKLSLTLGQTKILEDINFSIKAGEIVALLGDNGAGKSSFTRIVSGVLLPTSGELFWEGKRFSFNKEEGPRQARQMGIETVPQDLGLVDTLSIVRNFFLGRELKKKILGVPCLDLKRMEELTRSELERFGIRRKLDPSQSIKSLSGGERQAVAIARARYFGAKLLLLDEPTSALSLRQTDQVLGFITQAASEGMGVMFITHTLHHVEQIADRLTILYHGKKIGDFDPDTLSHEDRTRLILQGQREVLHAPTIS